MNYFETEDTKSKGKKKKTRNEKYDDLIGPTDPKVDNQARDRLISARVSLYLNHSFFGNLATRMKLINADEWCPTAAVDGRNFYYNSRFVMKLNPREVEFLVGHEVLHVVYDHLGRKGDRDHQLFNIANDYAVNADLKRHKVGEFITTVPCLYDKKYDTTKDQKSWSSEQIYDDLYENAEKISMDDLIDQLIDDHLDDEGDGDGSEKEGEGKKPGKGRPRLSQEERDQIRQEVKQAVISAANASEAGSIPAGVKRLLKDITNPVMPWRDLLQQDLVSPFKNDYSFQKVSRRSWHLDAILPGLTPGEEVDVVVFLDMSGSIGERQAHDFLGEVQGIMEAFDSYRIHLMCFDTEVYNPQVFTSENLDDITSYEPKGGGGTDFDCMFKYMKDEGITPKRLVVFTDGYPCGSWGDPDYADTTWIIHGDKDPNPPFGTWAIYDGK
jgi:predicted metal-dependent peptidase